MQLTEDCEYLDYFTEDEDLESAPYYNTKSYQILSVENGHTVLKKIKNLNIDKINSQSQFLVTTCDNKAQQNTLLDSIPSVMINQEKDLIRKSAKQDKFRRSVTEDIKMHMTNNIQFE